MSSDPQVTLYTIWSPAAQCCSVALDELDIPYNAKTLSVADREQKSEWYLKINPNGRLPALIDHSREDFIVWESSAILLYIAHHFDTEHQISYDPVKDPKLYSEQLQWIFFSHGGLAPMQGQAAHWLRFDQDDNPSARKRYQDETKRLYSVLEGRLNGREWLVGSHYSIADMKAFTWVRSAIFVGINLKDYPNLDDWVKRITTRPKTDRGMMVPSRWDPDAGAAQTIEQSRALAAALWGFKKFEQN